MKSTFLFLVLIAFSATAQTQEPTRGQGPNRIEQSEIKRYTKVPEGYLMVLQQGDDIFKELEKFAKTENIPSANFTGMGFASNVRLGFYNFETKKFEPKEFQKVEIASMNGTIGKKGGNFSIHMHCVVTGRDFKAYGGHTLSGTVGTGSVEIMILVHDKTFERQFNSKIGADVLCLENCK